MPAQSAERFAFPVSFPQERMWFLERSGSVGAALNVNTVTELTRPVDADVLERALNEIVGRHESLRTTFSAVDGRPHQVVTSELRIPLRSVDLTSLPRGDREQEARRIAEVDARQPFDLETGPLLRATLVRLAPSLNWLLVSMHHIVSDGWSMGVFWRELTAVWNAFVSGRPSPLPPLPLQYPDFAVWQRRAWDSGAFSQQVDFWRRQLSGASATELISDRPRPPVQSSRGATFRLELNPDLGARVRQLARDSGTTPYVVLLAGFIALLHRYTEDEDVVLGSYIAGRNQPELEGMIGFFLNPLVLRCAADADTSFRELISRAQRCVLEADAHQDVPFAKVVEALRPPRDLSRNPFFQLMFQMLNVPTLPSAAAESHRVTPDRGSAVFDMSWMLEPDADGGYSATIEYAVDLFEPTTIQRLSDHYRSGLLSGLADPGTTLGSLELMTRAERRRVTETWTRNERPRPVQQSLVSAFTSAVADHRDEVAFFDETQTLTFGELHEQATNLAARLAGRGVGRGDLVAVCLDRSASFAAAVLGILMAGAAYVAFEPDDPEERVRLIVEDAKPAAMVCADDLPWLGPQPARVPVVAAADGPEDAAEFVGPPGVPPPDAVAFVVYTSGSQGEPKGVEISEAAVLNRLAWMWETYPFAPDEVCCQRTPANFIDAGWELLGPLLQGVPSVVVPTSTVRNVPAFVDRLAAAGVTRLWLVPSLLRAMLDAVPDLAGILPKLTFWVSSGEALPTELFERFCRAMPHATLYNLYGTSEVWDATWWSPGAEVTGATVPIGRPIHNAEVYVVDRRLRPVPTGVPGELLVGGAGVGGGYLNRAQLTAERFLPNPIRPETEALVYRTGDRVRYLADGNVEYLGRSDRQVKVRGGRVELAEVEAAMLSFPGVRDALVVDRSGERGPWLAGYYVPATSGGVRVDDLRAHLRRRVPEFMLPSALVELAALPLSYNGKIDRSALPEPTVARGPRLAGTRWERLVADLWRDALGISDVSVNDNFFDIGGHSMLVIDVHTRLRRLVGNSLTVTDLFEHPTIAELARHCQVLCEDETHVG